MYEYYGEKLHVYQFWVLKGVALAVNDFSSGIMTASTGDDNSTKELKGKSVTFSSALNGVKESLDVMSTNDDNTLGFTLELYSRYMDTAKEMLFRRTCKLVEYENATKHWKKPNPRTKKCFKKPKTMQRKHTIQFQKLQRKR
ncbi:uncharacterized protein [Pocillopora verrucosa]|uniref:uncharacterized protein n=1 Tax=Pocillopora verrucosa TaxID=203993 RepID=UPI00333F6C95